MINYNFKKKDLIKNISIQSGFSSNLTNKLINDLIKIISGNILEGELNLKNIGTFKLVHKNERIGRNPKTKKEYKISPRKTISFKVSKRLVDSINLYE